MELKSDSAGLIAPLYHAADSLGLYRAKLEQRYPTDTVTMQYWFRRHHHKLGTTPLLALIDQGRFEEVINQLRT